MENEEHYFYVVSCKDDSLYAGYTNNLKRRIKLHNEGKGAKYTCARRPVRLVYSKGFSTKSEAMKAEYAFKQWDRKKKLNYLIKEGSYVATEKSFEDEQIKGILYLVPTPIGNLEDMSYRAIRILKEADYIAAEDTRNSKKLCHYFEIETPLMSYHEHNKETSGKKIVNLLKEGAKIALISDAGLPTISDPGYEVVVSALEEQLTVVPLPGANAALTALIASGISTQPFYFFGFLDRQKKEKRKQLEELLHVPATIILYEAPHRLKETLTLIHEVLGNRNMAICRELTKKFEEFIRGTASELINWVSVGEVRGEFCLIIEKGEPVLNEEIERWWDSLTVVDHVKHYIEVEGLISKDAIKQVATDRNMNKREVYHMYHVEG